MAFYRLPGFIAGTLSSQPKPPRSVPVLAVVTAVVAGADCAIYLFGAVAFVALGLAYRFTDTGEFGRYYMQQTWALALRQDTRIWVVRINGRDVLYAPVVS
jgi:hypothetical protein